jgi:hypothetical protein
MKNQNNSQYKTYRKIENGQIIKRGKFFKRTHGILFSAKLISNN